LVLEPVEYIAYIEDIVNIPHQYALNNHMYADNTAVGLCRSIAVAGVHLALNRLRIRHQGLVFDHNLYYCAWACRGLVG